MKSVTLLLLVALGFAGQCRSAQISKDARSAIDIMHPDFANVSYRDSLGRTLKADTENCSDLLDPQLVETIKGYQPIADQIINLLVNGELKGKTYDELEKLVDLYPIRQSGFQNLEDSIDYMMERMRDNGLQNVRGEQVLVPHWVR